MVVAAVDDPPVFGDPFVNVYVVADKNPVTQGSVSHGRGNTFNDHQQELMVWREMRIAPAVRRQRGRDAPCVEGPVVVTLTFRFARPASTPAWRQWPIGREAGGTDIDKAMRGVLDGVARTVHHKKSGPNKGMRVVRGAEAFSDDGNVIDAYEKKMFVRPGEPPGCQIQVWAVDPRAERGGWTPVPDWPGWRYVRSDAIPLA